MDANSFADAFARAVASASRTFVIALLVIAGTYGLIWFAVWLQGVAI